MTELPLLTNVAAYSAQVLCIVALGGLLSAVLRTNTPAVRHAYWRALVVLCIALPWIQERQVSTIEVPVAPTSVFLLAPGADPAGKPAATAATASTSEPSPAAPSPIPWPSWPQAVLVLLATGAGLRLLWLTVGLMRLARLRHHGHAAVLSESEEALRATIAPRASVRDVSTLRQPVTFGILKPVVLLPESLRTCDPDIRHAVLCHELHHARRADWASVLIEELVLCALWFHPAAWWLVSRVQLSREEVVDELVVRTTGTRRTYIEALMLFSGERGLAPAPSFSRRQHLFRRIVLLSKETHMSMPRLLSSLCVWAAVIGGGIWYASGTFPLSAAVNLPAIAVPPLAAPAITVPGITVQANAAPDIAASNAAAPSPRNEDAAASPAAQTATQAGAQQSATATPRVPRQTVRIPVEAPPEMTAVGATGVVLFRIAVDAAGRVVDPTLAGYAISASTPTARYKAVQEEPLPSTATVFADDPAWESAAEAMNRAALIAVRQFRYEPPTDTSRFYAAVMVPSLDGFVLLTPNRPTMPTVDPSGLAATGGPGIGPFTTAGASSVTVDSDLRRRAQDAQRAPNATNSSQGGAPGPTAAGIAAGTPSPTTFVAPSPPPPMPPGEPIRVGGNIAPPKKIKDVRPAYPEEARAERLQGIVILEITIAASGHVVDARILRSIPGLDDAAVAAVKQWEFTPTLLNGVPVAIVMSVTMNFTLN